MKKITSRLGFVLLALAFLAQSQPPGKTSTSAPQTGQAKHPPGTKGGPMVFIPAGEFTMGLSSDAAFKECQKYCSDCKLEEFINEESVVDREAHPTGMEYCQRQRFINEEPAHRVSLDAFYIDKFEVTQGEYKECVRAGSCKDNKKYDGFTGDRQPVVGVTWNQAKAYCEWAGKRLPTEAEWEKAARGTDGRMYPWGNQKASCELANYDDCKMEKTWPVGTKPDGASPYGALDMAGNVWEWVADWYEENYYSHSPNKNPTGSASGSGRVLRGGSWFDYPGSLHASNRVTGGPDLEYFYGGFRCSGD